MVKHLNKRIKSCQVGNNVLVPIPIVDKIFAVDLFNVPGVD